MAQETTIRLRVRGCIDPSGCSVRVEMLAPERALVATIPLPDNASRADIENATIGVERLLDHLPPVIAKHPGALIV